MESIRYMITHFFTHKDFLPVAPELPGTMFTPLQLSLELGFFFLILLAVAAIVRRPERKKTCFTAIFVLLLLWEVAIDLWDSLAGAHNGFDLALSLPLYPCSIFLYTLPFVIWGKGIWKEMAEGYICTLGLVGALINFAYPVARLLDYSCISFPAFHTFFYHGSMLFVALTLLLSGEHQLHRISSWWKPFLASVPGLLASIPANLMNYSPIHSDYMYFTGQHALSQSVFGAQASAPYVTASMYGVYLFGPVLFYFVPWSLKRLLEKVTNPEREAELAE